MYEYNARIIRVVDGDTVVADIDLGFDVHVKKKLRIADYDAPEISHADNPKEKELGIKAKLTAEMMLAGRNVILRTGKKQGKYGRWIASIEVGGKDFASEMRQAGYVK